MVIAACQAAQSDKSKWKKISEEGVETVSVTGTEGGYNFEIVEQLRAFKIEKHMEMKQLKDFSLKIQCKVYFKKQLTKNL